MDCYLCIERLVRCVCVCVCVLCECVCVCAALCARVLICLLEKTHAAALPCHCCSHHVLHVLLVGAAGCGGLKKFLVFKIFSV